MAAIKGVTPSVSTELRLVALSINFVILSIDSLLPMALISTPTVAEFKKRFVPRCSAASIFCGR